MIPYILLPTVHSSAHIQYRQFLGWSHIVVKWEETLRADGMWIEELRPRKLTPPAQDGKSRHSWNLGPTRLSVTDCKALQEYQALEAATHLPTRIFKKDPPQHRHLWAHTVPGL